jgi:hypothetical protein
MPNRMGWIATERGLENGEYLIGPPPSEDCLAFMYLRLKENGLLNKVFYQGLPTVREFLEWNTNSGNEVVGCYRRRISDVEFIGMGWVNAKEKMAGFCKAEVGFCFMPEVNVFAQIRLIRGMVTRIFQVTDFWSIFGTTPDQNGPAVKIIERVGLHLHGPIPNFASWKGQPCAVYISEMDRETWFNLPSIQKDFPAIA